MDTDKLEWRKGHRNAAGNMQWTSRCGTYQVKQAINGKFYTAWFQDTTPIGTRSMSTKLGMMVTRFRYRTKRVACEACDNHKSRPHQLDETTNIDHLVDDIDHWLTKIDLTVLPDAERKLCEGARKMVDEYRATK